MRIDRHAEAEHENVAVWPCCVSLGLWALCFRGKKKDASLRWWTPGGISLTVNVCSVEVITFSQNLMELWGYKSPTKIELSSWRNLWGLCSGEERNSKNTRTLTPFDELGSNMLTVFKMRNLNNLTSFWDCSLFLEHILWCITECDEKGGTRLGWYMDHAISLFHHKA